MSGKTMTGARAKVYVDGVLVGLFDSVNYNINIGAEPIHLLGRFSPDEIAITSYEAVGVQASGFRVIGQGGHLLPKVPKLQDLLNFEYITLVVVDRKSEEADPIATVKNCVPIGLGTGYQAKATSRVQITYLGTVAEDESGSQDESSGATTLP